MIQRRAVGLDPPNTSSSTASNRDGAVDRTKKQRRVRRVTYRKKWRWLKGISRVLTDEDSVVTAIRICSILVILGCFTTLSLHFFGPAEILIGDEDTDAHSWTNIILINLNRWFLGRNILQFALHRDHENTLHRDPGTNSNRDAGNSNPAKPGKFRSLTGKDFDYLTPSSVYTIPGSMPHIGDKSDHYADLRKEYDAMDLPRVEQRYKFKTMPMETVQDHASDKSGDNDDGDEYDDDGVAPAPYDIHDCPEHPPEGYPYAWNMLRILDHWNPDDVNIPEDLTIFQGLCVFDYEKDYQKALNYRRKELPFVVSNDPEVQEAAKRWMSPGYMDRMLNDDKHRTEYSETNHFMFWNVGGLTKKQQHELQEHNKFEGDGHPDGRGVDRDLDHWQQPTKMMRMTYGEWFSHADLKEGETVGTHDPHYYFRLIGCGEPSPLGKCDKGASEFLFDELTFFQPKENLYMVDPAAQRGIHCRFGMTGVIAENHFDMSRNAIALFGGERRYILAHPNQCDYMTLLPKQHPSARHSAVDWSDPDLEKYPEFGHALANEIVLQAGDVLYLPTNWFHYIISLNLNFQCNTRSGISDEYWPPIHKCGF